MTLRRCSASVCDLVRLVGDMVDGYCSLLFIEIPFSDTNDYHFSLNSRITSSGERFKVRDHRVESVILNVSDPDSIYPFSAARISAAKTPRVCQD
jgi:hypothetical protein